MSDKGFSCHGTIHIKTPDVRLVRIGWRSITIEYDGGKRHRMRRGESFHMGGDVTIAPQTEVRK